MGGKTFKRIHSSHGCFLFVSSETAWLCSRCVFVIKRQTVVATSNTVAKKHLPCIDWVKTHMLIRQKHIHEWSMCGWNNNEERSFFGCWAAKRCRSELLITQALSFTWPLLWCSTVSDWWGHPDLCFLFFFSPLRSALSCYIHITVHPFLPVVSCQLLRHQSQRPYSSVCPLTDPPGLAVSPSVSDAITSQFSNLLSWFSFPLSPLLSLA